MKKVSATRFLRVHMFGPGTKCRCASCSQLPDDCTYIVIVINDAFIFHIYILYSYFIFSVIYCFQLPDDCTYIVIAIVIHNFPWSLLPSRTVQGSKSSHPRSKSTIASRWGGGIYAGTLLLYAQVQLQSLPNNHFAWGHESIGAHLTHFYLLLLLHMQMQILCQFYL